MKSSAKQLCASLITRSIKNLSEDEEEIIVDYLSEKLKIDVDLDTSPKDLCMLLLEKLMVEETGGKKIPITAYANKVLGKEQESLAEKERKRLEIAEKKRRDDILNARLAKKKTLEFKDKNLPGCATNPTVNTANKYEVVLDPEIGIMELDDGSTQYSAGVSVDQTLYEKIFGASDRPVIEIISPYGIKTFSRILALHNEGPNVIYVSPLVFHLLEEKVDRGVTLRLCNRLPYIKKVDFTFYGTQEELNGVLRDLIEKIPNTINALSYLSLGMEITENIRGRDYKVMVSAINGYYDDDEDPIPIFVGLIPTGDSDIPFDISPDL